MDHVELTPELLLQAYANGVFPMGEGREDDRIYWVAPEMRGLIPLDGFNLSRSLARLIRSERYSVRFNSDFRGVMHGCADRDETWINDTIIGLYGALHDMGFGHSVEVYEEDQLVGGSYGIALGGAYFGESMYSKRPNVSKLALAYQVTWLRRAGFRIFDTQFLTPHLESLGGIEMPQNDYRKRLEHALDIEPDAALLAAPVTSQEVLQMRGQRSNRA